VDCERASDGWLDEPVNALSSVAYVVAGVWMWRRDRWQGAALVAVGAGSVAYHGFGGTMARWLHDATIAALAVVLVAAAGRIARGARTRPRLAGIAVAAFAVALPLQVFGRTGGPLCRPDAVLQAHAGWHVLTAVAIACAFAIGAPLRTRTRSARS
jgi:hypothetical protein